SRRTRSTRTLTKDHPSRAAAARTVETGCSTSLAGSNRRAFASKNRQARPRRAANAKRAQAGEGLTPGQRRHRDLGQGEHHIVAGDGSWNGEYGRNHEAQSQRSGNSEGDLTGGKCQRAGHTSDEQRADDAGATVERYHPANECDEKRQGMHCQCEYRPAEQADAERIENKPKRGHGGGSICMDLQVAPSTTTMAQLRI
ncbi:hypothetical protein, partial [Bradyrhizobium sp. USDA 3458]|uniref:hypothetical protein n=1 Tax=Bradyrhizobium sp. USDA 3458 TaxID=2591461 RepID=UPI001AED59AA